MHDLIQRAKPHGVPEDVAWRLILQSALGLAHIHSLKILHRDVKSENIFLDAAGNAKIGDLGVAKTLTHTEDLGRTLVGTPFYLSPELCDRRPYDAKSDVWSLGVVLYETVTGKPPFRANGQAELFLKILDGDYHPLRVGSRGVSVEMRDLVRAMLETDASRRVDAIGVVARPASVAKARALGVALEEASRDETDKTDTIKKTERPRTAVSATRRIPSASGDEADTTEPRPRGASRPATTRAGLRAEALAEAEPRLNAKKKKSCTVPRRRNRAVPFRLRATVKKRLVALGRGLEPGDRRGIAAAAAGAPPARPPPRRTWRRRPAPARTPPPPPPPRRGAQARARAGARSSRRRRRAASASARASARGRSVGTPMRRLRRASAEVAAAAEAGGGARAPRLGARQTRGSRVRARRLALANRERRVSAGNGGCVRT